MKDYMNRVQYMFGVKKYFPPPVVEDKLVQTLLQQGLKWKIIETYHVGTLMLRKTQINGLSQSTIKFLNEYRWKSSNNYSDPNEVTDSELMSALIQFESQREQDFQERKTAK